MSRPYDPLIGPKKLNTIYKTQNMGIRKKMVNHMPRGGEFENGSGGAEFESGSIGYCQLDDGTIIEVDLDSMRCRGGAVLCWALLSGAMALFLTIIFFCF